MTLALRPLSVRLRVAYMATAMRAFTGNPVRNFDAGSTWDRHIATDWGASTHPYVRLWQTIGRFYQSQGFDKLCDAEIHDRFNAAWGVGFKLPDGRQVPATAVHAAMKQWDKQGWFRYEHQHAGRMKIAKRVGLFGLAFVGIPMVSDL